MAKIRLFVGLQAESMIIKPHHAQRKIGKGASRSVLAEVYRGYSGQSRKKVGAAWAPIVTLHINDQLKIRLTPRLLCESFSSRRLRSGVFALPTRHIRRQVPEVLLFHLQPASGA